VLMPVWMCGGMSEGTGDGAGCVGFLAIGRLGLALGNVALGVFPPELESGVDDPDHICRSV
jgi:hypothetical protein